MIDSKQETSKPLFDEDSNDSDEYKVDLPRRASGMSRSESAKSLNIEDSDVREGARNKTSMESFYGYSMMLVGVILFSLSTVFCKQAYINNHKLTGWDYLIIRSTILAFMALIQAIYLKVNLFDIK